MCDNRRRTYCCVFGCLNNSSIPELSLFRLPIELERRLQWLRLIDREDLINKSQPKHVVCEVHFHPEDIMKNSVRKLLKKNCLPSLNLPNLKKVDKHTQVGITSSYNNSSQTATTSASGSNEIDVTIATSSCQTDINTTDNLTQTTAGLSTSTPRKRKLKSELLECKKRLGGVSLSPRQGTRAERGAARRGTTPRQQTGRRPHLTPLPSTVEDARAYLLVLLKFSPTLYCLVEPYYKCLQSTLFTNL